MKRVCAWCVPKYIPTPGEVVTHGICPTCRAKMECHMLWLIAFEKAFDAFGVTPDQGIPRRPNYAQIAGRGYRGFTEVTI
jgi:hypothetical protein